MKTIQCQMNPLNIEHLKRHMYLSVKQDLWIQCSFSTINNQNQRNKTLVAIAEAYGIPHEVRAEWQRDVTTSRTFCNVQFTYFWVEFLLVLWWKQRYIYTGLSVKRVWEISLKALRNMQVKTQTKRHSWQPCLFWSVWCSPTVTYLHKWSVLHCHTQIKI